MNLNRACRVAVVTVTAALALAGCKGASTSKPSPLPATSAAPTSAAPTSAAPTSAAPTSPSTLTEGQAQVLAAAGVLTAADLPGYRASAESHDGSDDADDAKLATCVGTTAGPYLTRNYGFAYTKGMVEVDSKADVATSADQAAASLAAFTSARAVDCFKTVLTAGLAAEKVTVTSLTVSKADLRVDGADGAFAYEFHITATSQGQTIAFAGYDIGVLIGQTQVALSDLAQGGDPVPLTTLEPLMATLVTRVRAVPKPR